MSDLAEAILGSELHDDNCGRYRLLKFLGGGQTANVYQAKVLESRLPERRGCDVAVKLMIPGLDEETQRRFFREVAVMTDLRAAEQKIREEFRLAKEPTSVPEVWGQQRTGDMRFFVMTLAPGVPLDQLLRGGKPLSEVDALAITAQLLVVFAALHEGEGLHRSYLDFQPRNIFWQADPGRITVVDWNLLSAEGQADVAADLRSVGRLLYRMVVGTDVPDPGDGLGAALGWSQVSPGTRQILARALDFRRLEPSSGATVSDVAQDAILRYGSNHLPSDHHLGPYEKARDFYHVVNEQWALWHQDVERLVVKAGNLLQEITEAKEQRRSPDEIAAQRKRLQEAVTLYAVAERRGISGPNMQEFQRRLHEEIEKQQRRLAPLSNGRAFLKIGGWRDADEQFALAAQEAQTPQERLAVWRCQEVRKAAQADAAQYKVHAETINGILETLEAVDAWMTPDWEAFRRQVEAIPWPGLDPIRREMIAYAGLQQTLRHTAPPDAVTDDTTVEADLEQLQHILDALNQLSGKPDEPSYQRDAWAFIGDGNFASGKAWVERLKKEMEALAKERNRIKKEIDAADSHNSREGWLKLLGEFRGDSLIVRSCLKTCLDWIAQDRHREALDLLNDILDYSRIGSEREQAMSMMRLAVYFQDVKQGLGALKELYEQKARQQGRVFPHQTVDVTLQ